MYKWNGSEWKKIGGKVNLEEKVVVCDKGTKSLGTFALWGKSPEIVEHLKKVVIYPNPFIPKETKDGRVKFINLPENAEIEIFTVSGEFIIKLDNPGPLPYGNGYYGLTWNGENEWGESVASGLYFCIIKDGDDIVVKKLSVLRK
jgi:hypothetical protein